MHIYIYMCICVCCIRGLLGSSHQLIESLRHWSRRSGRALQFQWAMCLAYCLLMGWGGAWYDFYSCGFAVNLYIMWKTLISASGEYGGLQPSLFLCTPANFYTPCTKLSHCRTWSCGSAEFEDVTQCSPILFVSRQR